MNFINTTPHAVVFLRGDGTPFTIPPCGILINARPVEEPVGSAWTEDGQEIALVRTRFEPDPESERLLRCLEDIEPKPIIFGSIISAQAFPGRVLGMIAAPGFERVPVAEKRMRADKFTTFAFEVREAEEPIAPFPRACCREHWQAGQWDDAGRCPACGAALLLE